MNKNLFTLLVVSLALLVSSCSNDDTMTPALPSGEYENGILISHEGNFGQGNASVSFVSYDFMTVENGIFNAVNSSPLGDTAQSIAFNGDLAYIVLNVSNSIEIVNRFTFESVASITDGLINPRHIAFANGKGYVTNWGDGTVATDDYIAIIDLTNNSLEAQTISVDEGPEEIVAIENSVYVAHEGGFGQNNVVSVIEASSNAVSTITVGDVPNSLQLDNAGNLWVLCGGKPAWTGEETPGQLVKINTSDHTSTIMDFETSEHPNFLSIDNGNIYYYMTGNVYHMETTATSLPTTSEISGLNFYGMTTRNGVLYALDTADFASNGSISSYDLTTNTLMDTVELGIIPSEIYFN